MKFEVGSDMAGKLRILVLTGAEPDYLPGAAKAHGGPLWPYTRAAVEAAPSAESDGAGLFWMSLDEAERALVAVRAAEVLRELGAALSGARVACGEMVDALGRLVAEEEAPCSSN